MSGSAIKAGRAYVELFLDDSRFQAGLTKAAKTLEGVATGLRDSGMKIAGVGAAIVGGLAVAAVTFAETGSALNDMSARTGLSVEQLSRLEHAAGMVGASLEDVEMAAKSMAKVIDGAIKGEQASIQTLDALGLTLDDVAGLSQDQRFVLFAERLSRIEDPALRVATALDVFGKSGTRLLPLLNDNAKALKELMAEAESFGLVMSTAAAAQADEFGDALDLLKKLMKQTVIEIGGAVVPAFMDWVQMAQQIVKATNEWIKKNPELVNTILKVGVALVVVGGSIISLGVAAQALSFVFAGLGIAMSAAFTAVQAPIAIVSGLLTALSSPLGALFIGVGSVVGAFVYLSGTGGAAIQWLKDRFGELSQVFTDTWGGIVDAVKAGDLQLAMEIAWTGIRLAWSQGVLWVLKIWNGLKLSVLTIWNDAVAGLQKLGSDAVVGLMTDWLKFSTFFQQLWNDIAAGFMNKWAQAIGWVEKKIHDLMGLFDSSYDAEAAKRVVDDRIAQETQQRSKAAQTQNAALDAEKQKRIDEAGQIAIANQNAYTQDAVNANKALEAEYSAREQAMRKEIEDLRKQLSEMSNAAAAKLKAKAPPGGKFDSGVDAESKKIAQAKDSISTMGTFSSEGLFGFGTFGTAQERTAKATEETAKSVKDLVKLGNDNQGGAFV